MFSFLLAKDRWKWDPANGVPTKKVIKLQRQTLRSGSADVKRRLLGHIGDLAKANREIQGVFCDGKVTADVSRCFLADAAPVQEAAAEALTALCQMDPANCEATISAHQAGRGGNLHVIPHALKLIQSYEKAPGLATAAANLLNVLAATAPDPVTQLLLAPGGTSGLLAVVQACSRSALEQGAPVARVSKLLELLQRLLALLLTVGAGGGPPMCRELGKSRGLGLLLELTEAHRGSGLSAGAQEHAAVVRHALSLLELITSQVPAQRLPFLEADGVRRLLEALRDQALPWSVRLHAVTALQAAAASPNVTAELVKAGGLAAVFTMVDAFVSGRQVPGALGATTTPPRGIALAGAAGASSSMAGAAAASPFSPAGAALSPLSSSLGSPSGPGGAAEEPEPRIVEVVEELLRLVDAVAASPDAPAVLEGNRLSVLMAAFNSGMPNFQGGGYRVAAECAQVLFRLSLHSAGALLSSLSGPHVTGPLAALVRRGKDYATAADAKQAQVLYGAWCAAGLLCQVLDAKRTQGRVQEVLHGDVLRCAVELLDGSAPALLAAVGVLPPPSGGGEGSLAAQAVGLAGLVFLSTERVTAALCAAASRLLSLLMELARDMANQQALRGMGAAKAAQQLLSWQQVQWSAKRLLHLMGIMEAEYQPFVRYGGPLLAALLGSQGVSAAPFLARGVDAHILLGLDDHYLRTQLGLDEVAVLKVARIRSAYSLFAAMDAEDGRMDGCVSAADVETYMQNRANMRLNTAVDLRERLFMELKVLPGEPICFMQFVNCFPWLDAELQAFMPHRLSPAGPADASRDPYAVQSTKRRRVGDAYGGGGAGGSGSAAAGRAGGAQVIEVD